MIERAGARRALRRGAGQKARAAARVRMSGQVGLPLPRRSARGGVAENHAERHDQPFQRGEVRGSHSPLSAGKPPHGLGGESHPRPTRLNSSGVSPCRGARAARRAGRREFEEARTGAFRVLSRLREEGVIKAWALGVNHTEPIELTLALDEPRPDGFCSPAATHSSTTSTPCGGCCRWPRTRTSAWSSAAPTAPASSPEAPTSRPGGATGDRRARQQAQGPRRAARHQHQGGRPAVLPRPPMAAAPIPGATRTSRIAEDIAALNETIPAAFWSELRSRPGQPCRTPPRPRTDHHHEHQENDHGIDLGQQRPTRLSTAIVQA